MIVEETLNQFLLKNGYRRYRDSGWVFKTFHEKVNLNVPYISKYTNPGFFTLHPKNMKEGFIIDSVRQIYKYSDYLEQRKIQV